MDKGGISLRKTHRPQLKFAAEIAQIQHYLSQAGQQKVLRKVATSQRDNQPSSEIVEYNYSLKSRENWHRKLIGRSRRR